MTIAAIRFGQRFTASPAFGKKPEEPPVAPVVNPKTKKPLPAHLQGKTTEDRRSLR